MTASVQLDDAGGQLRRFRFSVACGIAIVLLFCISSFIDFADSPTLISGLSAATDSIFLLGLIGIYVLAPRLRLGTAALALGAMILAYSVCNVLLFPMSLLRVVGQPVLAVSIAAVYLDSARLRGLSVAAWITNALLVSSSSGPPSATSACRYCPSARRRWRFRSWVRSTPLA
jgi:hypothetical protein